MNNAIIKCINLTKSHQDGESNIDILKNITFELKKGEIIGVIGKSGSGKTTFLHLLAGLDDPTSGSILYNSVLFSSMSSNQIAKFRNVNLGFIYQFHHLLLDFSILENVSMPLFIAKKSKKEAEETAYAMLKKVNLANKINKYPSEISGGERQRVAVARAFVHKPNLIIADELTGNLDQDNTNTILDLIFEFNSDFNTSFLIATHDSYLIKNIPILFQIKNGRLFNYKS